MTDFGVELQPLAGGMSGETWLTEYAGERAVLRIYGGRSLRRGPRASEVDAAVLAWLAGLLPVPQVLEVRRGDPGADLPAVLVTSYLPGVLLADLSRPSTTPAWPGSGGRSAPCSGGSPTSRCRGPACSTIPTSASTRCPRCART